MATFEGYLFAKLHSIGTRSEGPFYLLQSWNKSEHLVNKKTLAWDEDPELHKFLGKKVAIEGASDQDGIQSDKITTLLPGPVNLPDMELKLEHDVLWVNKMPPSPPSPQGMNLRLIVIPRPLGPRPDPYNGVCSTTQVYDFSIQKGDDIIWQWSKEYTKEHTFSQVVTPVNLAGEVSVEYSERWSFSPEDIKAEGDYQARADFIASGHAVVKTFQVKFAV